MMAQFGKVKQAYLIMTAAVFDIENGVENLKEKDQSGGWYVYPDFGKCMHKISSSASLVLLPFVGVITANGILTLSSYNHRC